MAELNISIDQKLNMLTVIKELDRLRLPCGQTNRVFLCKCDCGNKTRVRLVHLCRDRIRSCGCLNGEKHNKEDEWLYNIWRGMKNRCDSDKYIHAHVYRKKGITVCDEWDKSFNAFREFAINNGAKKGLSIDRINNDKGYYPYNCRFTTAKIQLNNTSKHLSLDYKGRIIAFRLLLMELGKEKHAAAIRTRMKRGWSVVLAIDTPIRKGNYFRGKKS